MNDVLAVRLIQRIRNLDRYFQHLVEWERAFLQSLGERLPFEEFHHQIIRRALLTDVEDGTVSQRID